MVADGLAGMLSALVSGAEREIRLWHAQQWGFAEELLKCMQSGPELVTSVLKPFITAAEFKTAGGHGAWRWSRSHFGE